MTDASAPAAVVDMRKRLLTGVGKSMVTGLGKRYGKYSKAMEKLKK